MRRTRVRHGVALLWAVGLLVLPTAAQQGTINPRIPPPPPPPEQPASKPAPPSQPAPPASSQPAPPAAPSVALPAAQPPPPALPAHVSLPAGTRIAVVLQTPLSTRMARQGQIVSFRTSEPLRVADRLEIPRETEIAGTVVEVRRPGGFGKSGSLRVKIDRINLSTGGTAEVVARLDSQDMNGHGRLTTDNKHTTDLVNLAIYSVEGTLLGAQIKGGKGAAVGAGAGAAVALIIMMSHRGSDVYLEPGMPFEVILDQPVELPGKEIYAAQQSYERAHAGYAGTANSPDASGEARRNADGSPVDPDRPVLKRRPKRAQP